MSTRACWFIARVARGRMKVTPPDCYAPYMSGASLYVAPQTYSPPAYLTAWHIRVFAHFADVDVPSGRPSDTLPDVTALLQEKVLPERDIADISSLLEKLVALKPVMIQEQVSNDPWRLLVAVTLLNKTTAKVALPVFWKIMAEWPSPYALSQASEPQLSKMLFRLGTYNRRSKRLIQMSRLYMLDPPSEHDLRPSRVKVHAAHGQLYDNTLYPSTPISHLPSAGSYALDSYRIFCTVAQDPHSEEWKSVIPSDKELIRYLKWKWATHEQKEWIPGEGLTREASAGFLTDLIAELEKQQM